MSTHAILSLHRAPQGPHESAAARCAGEPLQEASVVVVLTHGRGGSADTILMLAAELDVPGVAYVAPEAAGHTWYPYRFLAPFEQNEPWLSSALDVVRATVETIAAAGIAEQRIVLAGFSQGGCLALHYGATHARRWGGLIGFSAGLIGPPGTLWEFGGSLDGTPVFLGCSDRDPHIPQERLDETADALARLGGTVDRRVYPGLGHTINRDELAAAQAIIRTALTNP
jgi:predicted esterase